MVLIMKPIAALILLVALLYVLLYSPAAVAINQPLACVGIGLIGLGAVRHAQRHAS